MSTIRMLGTSLTLAALAVACGGADVPTAPTRDLAPEGTGRVAATQRPGDPDAGALVDEAVAVCPAEFREPCTEMYLQTVYSGLPGVVCIFPGGQWAIGTPGGSGNGRNVGEACGIDGSGTIRAVIEGAE